MYIILEITDVILVFENYVYVLIGKDWKYIFLLI